ncbi:MAG: hypothetical protein KJZ69_01970 [Phycisphaerales bacterium]|nr:hypothetical protein [Phycisphaerales bacterium]
MSHRRINILLACVLVTGAASSALGQDYAVIDLGTLGGSATFPAAVNQLGWVTGTTSSPLGSRAFLWRNGVMEPRHPFGDNSFGEGINDLGEIVGEHGPSFNENAGLWLADGTLIDIGRLGNPRAWARDVNNDTIVVGSSHFDVGPIRGYVWEDGQFEILRSLTKEHEGSGATQVNADRLVLGGASYEPGGRGQAVIWRNGNPSGLGLLEDGRQSFPGGMNSKLQIVGDANVRTQFHAFLWENGVITDIHQPDAPAWHSFAMAINDDGLIVGTLDRYGTGDFVRACIWLDGELRELDEFLPPNTPWTLIEARDINNFGQIVGFGTHRGRQNRGFILSPVTPTLSLAPPVPGSAGRSNTLTATGAAPGARVHFIYGTQGGGAIIPGCTLQQNAIQLDSPTVIGTAIADPNGVASITRTVPAIARGQTILFQAVVQNECAISQLVVHTFE